MLPIPTDSGGRTRLLPASLPLRHFGAAALFHLAGWLLIASDPPTAGFVGGLGYGIAALHSFTLGTLTMTALGASLQLLPVATVQPIRAVRLAKGLWWLLCLSIATFVAGVARVDTVLAGGGAIGTAVGLGVHAVLLAKNLCAARRARPMIAFAWCALFGLVLVLSSGPALALHYRYGLFGDPSGLALAHLILACYGFLGMLTIGFSYLLIPMFMVTRAPSEKAQRGVLIAAAVSVLAAASLAASAAPRVWMLAPALAGLVAATVHSVQMFGVAARRRSRDAPWSLALMRVAWIALVASVAFAAVIVLDGARSGSPVLFAVVIVVGWLMSFMLAVTLRIVPFLASVHVKLRGGRMPLVSALTPAWIARSVAVAHALALAMLMGGVLAQDVTLARSAGIMGALGACAFVAFLLDVLRRAARKT